MRALRDAGTRKWLVFGTIAIGTFMSVMDMGSVNVALPTIASHFDSDLPTVQWVTIGHALMISILLLPMARLGDTTDRKRVYMTGLAIFSLGGLAAGAAQSMGMLIGAKLFQGIGSAMIQANAMAAVLSVFPGAERGKALGSHLSVVGSGMIVGPALGGALVTGLGWRSVFFFNAPLALVALLASAVVLSSAVLSRDKPTGRVVRFDWAGAALSGAVLLIFLMVMTNGHRAGWLSPPVVTGFAAVAAAIAAFIWWELRTEDPMLDLRLFKRRLVAFGVSAGWLSFMGSAAMIFVMPFYLQNVLGYSARDAGLMLIPSAVTLAIMGSVSGRLSDRFGWRLLNMGGLSMSAAGLFGFGFLLDADTPLGLIIPLMILNSAGVGMFSSPNNNSILSAVPRSRYGVITALTQLTRNSANVTSIALATAVIVATMASFGFEPRLDAVTETGGAEIGAAFVAGMHRAFFVMGGLVALGVVLSFIKGDRVTPEAGQAVVVEQDRPVAAPVAGAAGKSG